MVRRPVLEIRFARRKTHVADRERSQERHAVGGVILYRK